MAVDLATFSPKRILVCQLRQIGDVVLATPSIELLKRRYPDAEIHLLTEKKCAPLLEHNPHLGKVWALDKKVLSSLPQEIAWYWHVARTGYDLVVDFQQLPRCRWVVAFSGAPVRLSYTPPWYTRLLYTHSSDMLDGYSAMSKASVLRPLGIEWNGERPRVYLTDEEHAFARTLLAQAGLQPEQRLITLDPTHRQPTRRWPLAHYAGWSACLLSATPPCASCLSGGRARKPKFRSCPASAPPVRCSCRSGCCRCGKWRPASRKRICTSAIVPRPGTSP